MTSNPVDEIKNKLDVVDVIGGYIKVQKAGRNYKASCPFHSEKTPSFMISPERQLWRCFGCNRGGSIFDFIMEIEGVEFGDALKILAQRAGVELKRIDPKIKTKRTKLYEICSLANSFFIKQFEAGKIGKDMQKYLIERGLKQKTIKDWEIGYAPKGWQILVDFLNGRGYSSEDVLMAGLAVKSEKNTNRNKYYDRFRDRIIFPIKDVNGVVVGFTGRENPNSPNENMGKYINTPSTLIYDKSRILYGLDKARTDIRKKDLCILVEGQTDVIMSHQAGFANTVASSGTALTEEQLKIIKRYTNNLATAFDMDSAGEMATKKGIDLALQLGFNAKVISLLDNQDPADCIKKSASSWSKSINDAEYLIEFYLNRAFAKDNSNTIERKKEISKEILPIIKKITNNVEQSHWLQELAGRLMIQESALTEELKKIKDVNPYISNDIANNDVVNKKDILQAPPLEEYTLGLVLAYPKIFRKYKDKLSHLFTDPYLEEIFEIFKKNKIKKNDLETLKKNLSDSLFEKTNDIIFKTESQRNLIEEFNPEKEIEFCFLELQKRNMQKELNKLNLEMKQAEIEKNEVLIKKLTKDFNKLIKGNNII
ncbi:MAG: DNA primase [Patescibacteria group bacterium]|nr:DNA primase [Patescibacteria group bacterium]